MTEASNAKMLPLLRSISEPVSRLLSSPNDCLFSQRKRRSERSSSRIHERRKSPRRASPRFLCRRCYSFFILIFIGLQAFIFILTHYFDKNHFYFLSFSSTQSSMPLIYFLCCKVPKSLYFQVPIFEFPTLLKISFFILSNYELLQNEPKRN